MQVQRGVPVQEVSGDLTPCARPALGSVYNPSEEGSVSRADEKAVVSAVVEPEGEPRALCPHCKAVSWPEDTGKPCPECGYTMRAAVRRAGAYVWVAPPGAVEAAHAKEVEEARADNLARQALTAEAARRATAEHPPQPSCASKAPGGAGGVCCAGHAGPHRDAGARNRWGLPQDFEAERGGPVPEQRTGTAELADLARLAARGARECAEQGQCGSARGWAEVAELAARALGHLK